MKFLSSFSIMSNDDYDSDDSQQFLLKYAREKYHGKVPSAQTFQDWLMCYEYNEILKSGRQEFETQQLYKQHCKITQILNNTNSLLSSKRDLPPSRLTKPSSRKKMKLPVPHDAAPL